ncbi:MAG: DUF1566 domain-containing protein [Arcobacter sp.]|nr:DUF1566 domain-containing protein [Arcobacter sp.]
MQSFIVRLGHQSVYSKILQLFYNIFIKECKVSKQISSNNYWSSTTNASNTSNAWNVNFNNGNTNNNNKTNTNNVRCVRAGE